LAAAFPRLTRVSSYASPNSLTTKNIEQLIVLRSKQLKILYFGLESGDDATLLNVKKGYKSSEMVELASKASEAGIKISVTAILGLAGRERSLQHARATAEWVNIVSPEYFSLLTMFSRHNDEYIKTLQLCTRRELMLEAREMLQQLHPAKTIIRSNHVSNFINLAGSYPKDRERLIADVEAALITAGVQDCFLDEVPSYQEEYY
ncbi:MAG: radical SAM protein, partial [Desulfuromonadales bacterium]